MFKQNMVLCVKGNEERIHRLECDPTTPLGEVHDALETMKAFVIEEIKKHSKPLEEESENCDSESGEKCDSECSESADMCEESSDEES